VPNAVHHDELARCPAARNRYPCIFYRWRLLVRRG